VADDTRPLSIEECVAFALDAAPTADALRARLAIARAQFTTADTWPNPVGTAISQDIGRGSENLQHLAFSYPLLFSWTRSLEADAASARAVRVEHNVAEERRRVALVVGQAFHDLAAAEGRLGVEVEDRRVAGEIAAIADRRLESGDASRDEAIRARAEALDAERRVAIASRRVEVDRLTFSVLIGSDRPVPVRIRQEALLDRPPRGLATPSSVTTSAADAHRTLVSQATDRALERRPDMLEAEAAVEAADISIRLEDRRAVPLDQISISAGFRATDERTGGVVAISAPIPIFDRNQGGRERAAAERAAAGAERERVRRLVTSEVAAALESWTRSRTILAGNATPLAEARAQALALTRRRLESGDVALLDVLVAERDLVSARRALVEARRDLAIDLLRLELVVGGDVTDGMQIRRE